MNGDRELLELLVRRFDVADKLELARQLVDALELTEDESAEEKVGTALGRGLLPQERFRIRVLESLARDHDYFPPEPFPDSLGAPKEGR